MKLIKTKNGYVNADMIESFAVIKYEKHCDIIGYTPSYSDDCGRYYLNAVFSVLDSCEKADVKTIAYSLMKREQILDSMKKTAIETAAIAMQQFANSAILEVM